MHCPCGEWLTEISCSFCPSFIWSWYKLHNATFCRNITYTPGMNQHIMLHQYHNEARKSKLLHLLSWKIWDRHYSVIYRFPIKKITDWRTTTTKNSPAALAFLLKWCCSNWRVMASAWRTVSSIPPHPPPPRWSEVQRVGTVEWALPLEGHDVPAIGSQVKELDLVHDGCSRCW